MVISSCLFARYSRRIAAGALVAFLCALPGCFDDVWRGNVAIINGTGITLNQVAALRNSTYFEWTNAPLTEMDDMRKQYGEALTNLLAVELVKQYLKSKKLDVTDEEVAAEEERIRADYPQGTFKDMIIGESIDMESWRFLLKNHLSVQRFLDKVLKPNIVIKPEEIAAYFKTHPEEFVRPPWVHFYFISGGDKSAVEACAHELAATKNPVETQTNNPHAVVRTAYMDEHRLDPLIRDTVAKVEPGNLSEVIRMEDEFHQILLVERRGERPLEASEAFLLIEQRLLDQKYGAAYNTWLADRMAKATIKIAAQLLPQEKNEPKPTGTAASSGEVAPPKTEERKPGT